MLKKAMSCSFELNEETFIALKNAGIEAIEISYRPEDIDSLNYQQVKDLSQKYGIELWSYHLPFWWIGATIDAASHDKSVRDFSLKLWQNYVKKGAEIGIKRFVVHPSSEPKSQDINERNQEIEYSRQTLSALAEYAKQFGAIICVEDLPRTCLGRDSKELLNIVSAHENLKICFDTNHLLSEDLLEFVNNTRGKIETLHVSDYDYIDERHWLPGEGKIDWHSLYNKLIDCGYNGPWLYELGIKTRPNIINRSRELTFEDLTRNATEIFEGKDLTLI